MSSKREEERNEKIIRGLMKLPPNRRCINCNSLGPQYVCINFWTFVCMTCSGIHREFTHRVKSVSMSKFTSQEVEALQNGGNQRAKEMFLKDWDFERQRLPNVNNIEKVREFIKHVYVDRKYATGKSSEKPPRDMQSQRTSEAETRRASSYHSYSQSPPYDFQYEERSNRKHGVMLTRKPGSDRGIYEGKGSGLYSPGRYSDHMTEERFTIEGSSSRVSDYSFSSGGDPFRSHPQSPNSVRGSGVNSPTFDHSKESQADIARHQAGITYTEVHVQSDGVVIPNAQRMVSSTTCGNNAASALNPLNFANFANFAEAFPQSEQPTTSHQNKTATVPSSQSSAPVNTTTVDLFKETHEINPVNLASPVDLHQSPVMPSVVDLFQVTSDSSASIANLVSTHTSLSSMSFFEENSQISKDVNSGATHSQPASNNLVSSGTPSLSSLSFFQDIPQNSSDMNVHTTHSESAPNTVVSSHTSSMSLFSFLDENTQNPSAMNSGAAHSDLVSDNAGWATFDLPQHASTSKSHDFVAVAEHSGTGASLGNFSSLSASHGNTQWPDFLSSTAHGVLPPTSDPQHENLPYNPALALAPNNQEWRPFDDIDKKQGGTGHILADKPSTADHYLGSIESEDFSKGRSQSTATPLGTAPGLHVNGESSSVDQSAVTFMGELHSHFERTTSNPFDIPYDAEFDAGNMHFYDMSTLQAALPKTDSSFAGAMSDSWFLQDAANPCLTAPPPGGMSYMAAQAPSSQLPNVQTHGPVASIGGNPFA